MDVMVASARRLATALDADPRISKVHFLGFQGTAEMLGRSEKPLRAVPFLRPSHHFTPGLRDGTKCSLGGRRPQT